MNSVPTVSLPQVATIIMGQSPPGSTYNENGEGLPFFQGKAEFGEVSPTPKKWCSVPQRIAEPGDILMSVRAPVGPTNIASQKCCIGRGLAAIRSDAAQLENSYLRYFLRHVEPQVARMGQGSTFAAIGRSEISSLRIAIPPLGEQRRIVDQLSRVEGIVRLRRQARAKATEIIPALFFDMFGDPHTNMKAWQIASLCEVAEVISGIAKGRKLAPGEGIPLPYMRVANVKDGYLDLTEVKTIEVRHDEVDRLLIQPGDLLMTEGGDPDKLGRAALWSGEIDSCVHQNHIFKVRCNRHRVLPTYLRSLAASSYGKGYFLGVAKKTTGIASINKTQLSAFRVLLPPIELQERFSALVASTEAMAGLQGSAIGVADATFQALLSHAFSGDEMEVQEVVGRSAVV